MLEKVKQWLQTFPLWEDSLQIDYLEAAPGNGGLYPRGFQELSGKEDVLGNRTVRCRCTFLLRWQRAQSQDNAQWLMDFQNWVMEQDRLGLAPRFGDAPETQRIRALDGRLDSHSQAGCALYTVQLQVEFTRIFRGE
jgi:hypothetical protein